MTVGNLHKEWKVIRNDLDKGLVLSRKVDEKIMIGDNIRVTVVEVRGDKVRLLVSAPRDIPVHREEVYLAIKAEEKSAES